MIGPRTTIRGNISGDEDLTVEGRVEGSVRISKDLDIAPSAELTADLEANAVVVGGRVEGSINAAEALTVRSGATVVGDVTTARLVIEDGARFKGRVEMDVEIPDAPTRRR
ncbi:MAG: bactofilin family protein [Planctomycetota bacterium]|jgi:cytoskeletal protein CcmA (bactofilin family)